MNRKLAYLLVCLMISTGATTVAADDHETEPKIPEVASNTGDHGKLVEALTQAMLVDTLNAEGPFTVFAPTDQAFIDAGIDLSSFDTPEENETLADILLYHVYTNEVPSSAVTDGLSVVMANGDKASFTVTNDTVKIGEATVTLPDVDASNGIIHVIDKVLMPPAGDICYNVITHTIVPGATNVICNSYMYVENYTVAGQTITGCYNRVTHQVTNISSVVCGGYMWAPAVDIETTARATGIHTALVAALAKADLASTLADANSEFTVFAPSDEAFAAAGIDLDTFNTTEEIDALADILLYHVVAGTTLSTDLAEGANTVTTANGDELTIAVSEAGIVVGADGAVVTLADVPASNGVIHVIDKVLTPPQEVVEPAGPTCDEIIGIGASGLAYDRPSVKIEVGQTVCWKWENSDMKHNVAEIEGPGSTEILEGGIYSGTSEVTVDFAYTFTENTTFYYACEPHIASNMKGEIIVGTGVDASDETKKGDSEKSESTPGFLAILSVISMIGAAVIISRRNS